MGTGTKSKKTYLELLRIICAGLVIFNHIPGDTLYQRIEGKNRFLCMFVTMFARINVPIFFMISGMLLLGKQEDYRTVLKKRRPGS
jgi:surface polysaccharide O-acyltransferase-like enzyme